MRPRSGTTPEVIAEKDNGRSLDHTFNFGRLGIREGLGKVYSNKNEKRCPPPPSPAASLLHAAP